MLEDTVSTRPQTPAPAASQGPGEGPGEGPSEAQRGSPLFPEVSGGLPPSSIACMDEAVADLRGHAAAWLDVSPAERVTLLDRLIHDMDGVADRWIAACLGTKGLVAAGGDIGEEWLSGPYPIIRNMRLLRDTLAAIARDGRPRLPGPVSTLPNGQVSARVFPQNVYDRLFFQGITMDVWMEPGVTPADLPGTMALAYAPGNRPDPKVALVLAAGNASCIGPMDALYKLFADSQVVVYKTHPVNACVGPLVEEAFAALVDRGFMRVVHGGAAEGAYLCQHPGVDEIHITGSDKTFDAIMFGPGAEGRERKAAHQPRLNKRITAELGNISPLIVVPGPWSASDLAFQADSMATTLAYNAGFFCATTRVIVQHAGWDQRQALLDALGRSLSRVPARKAYYAGAQERHATFVAVHPEAELYGDGTGGRLPWTVIPNLDAANADEMCYSNEAFCSLMGEVALDAAGVPEYIDRAVEFANERLWGSLSATILVHPRSLQDPAVAAAVERAVANLRYGTVAINCWALVGFPLANPPWGAFPGNDIFDIGSGVGVVHNTSLFSRSQKTVVRAPFRPILKPPWFASFKHQAEVVERLTRFEADPSPARLPGIVRWALAG